MTIKIQKNRKKEDKNKQKKKTRIKGENKALIELRVKVRAN